MKSREELEALIEDAIGRVSVTSSLERDTLREATVKRMRKEILTALEAAGCEVVPREPPVPMQRAGAEANDQYEPYPTIINGTRAAEVYTAMLSVHPFRAKE